MFIATAFILAVLIFIYAAFYISGDLHAVEVAPAKLEREPLTDNYFLIFGLGVLATIPPTLRLTVKDDEEPQEEPAE